MDNYFGKVIDSYTRKQAISDGVLIDISKTAKEACFKYPVAITAGAMSIVKDIPSTSKDDFEGRLWDVLFMVSLYGRNSKSSELKFDLFLPHTVTDFESNEKHIEDEGVFKMVVFPGDDGKPVITIMLPNED